MPNVPVWGDPKWIAAARAVRHSRGSAGRRVGQPWAEIRGDGPEGKTCKSCKFLACNGGASKRYYKCGKVKITHGPGTDIRLRDQACILYEEDNET